MYISSSQTAPFSEPFWHFNIQPPHYKASHLRLQVETRNYVDKYINPYCEEWERAGMVPEQVYQRHAEWGFVAATVFPPEAKYLEGVKLPSQIPIEEWDGFHDHIVVDELTRCGFMGVVWALNCGNVIGCPPLVQHGTPEQKRRFLPNIYRGTTRFCLAVTEPDGKFIADFLISVQLRVLKND